jgi:tRNA(Ile)-lysidine synthase
VLICREPAALAPPVPAPPGASVAWDGRFRLSLPASAPPGLSLGALGPVTPEGASTALLPPAVRPSLPALSDAAGVVAVPHLGYRRGDASAALAALGLRFRPARTLTQGGFA